MEFLWILRVKQHEKQAVLIAPQDILIAPRGISREKNCRVQRFRYGEALTEDTCLQRLQDEERVKEKGNPEETQDLSGPEAPSAVIQTDEKSCRRCGRLGGRQWIACNLCDSLFHRECVTLEFPLEEIHEQDWLCDFCCQ